MAGNMNNLMAIHFDVGVDANYDYVCTRGFEIIDFKASTNATDGGSTTTMQTNVSGGGFVALGAALATDTVDDIECATTLVEAQKTVAAADTIRAVVSGSATADLADVYVFVIPTSWVAG